MSQHAIEITKGQRFAFGKNWAQFLGALDDERIAEAEKSLRKMLEISDLAGKRFLDVGSGSGLFSLAARRIGARVHSFDYDPQSVGCTEELKRRYFPADPDWTVEAGSVLDTAYLQALGQFDVVYSWGVLHHTGALWPALENVSSLVADGGKLFIAIYNDQGGASKRWARVKRCYNLSPPPLRALILGTIGLHWEIRAASIRLARLQNPLPFRAWREKKQDRGMSVWHDLVDWVGGYPFEVARPEEIFDFYRQKGYVLQKIKTCGSGHGCNEYVFEKGARIT